MAEYAQYSYVLAVRQSLQLNENCTIREFFHDLNLMFFDSHGYYYSLSNPGKQKGAYHFLEKEELSKVVQNSDWPLESECPFVGPVIGYCLFQPWEDDFFDYLVEQTLNYGLGFIVRIKDGNLFDIVAERIFTLREIVGKHGFGEGALLLMNTEDYFRYVREEIKKSLKPLGLTPLLFNDGDHPHILSGFVGDEKNGPENRQIFELNMNIIRLKMWVTDWDNKEIQFLLSQNE